MKSKKLNIQTFFQKTTRLIKNITIYEKVLTVFIVIFIAYYTVASFARYDNFYTGRYDLGNMTQTVWNTANGRFFEFTNPDEEANVSRLAFHADYILILFAPLYWIVDNPKVLLIIQTVTAGLGVIFVYLISLKYLKNKLISLAFSFSYLVYPALGWTILFDFHPIALATTFLLAAFYFMVNKHVKLFLVFSLLAGLCKEEVWFTIALFGLYIFVENKQKLLGTITFIVSLLLFYFLIWHEIPGAAATNAHFATSYFENGDSPTAIIKNIIFSPGQTITTLLDEGRIEYFKNLFLPLGFLPAFFFFPLLLAAPDLVLNFLSDKEELHQIYYHYSSTLTPFIFISAILTLYYLRKFYPKFWKIKPVAFFILFSALLGQYLYGPLPWTQQPNTEMFVNPLAARDEISQKLKEIPINKSVASTNEIGAQLSHRETIYTTGIDVTIADYVAIFMRTPDPIIEEYNFSLIEELKNNSEYELWYNKNNLTIFRKIN